MDEASPLDTDAPFESAQKTPAPSPLQALKLKWQAEKSCPEILGHAGPLLEEVQQEIDDLEFRLTEAASDPKGTLEAQLMTMDLDRARFVVRSYLRCRILKIDKFFLQIFSDADLFDRLSTDEQEHCERSIRLTQKHLEQAVLSKMPPQYGSMLKQHDTSEHPDMIPEADLDAFVFCKANEPLSDIQLEGDDTVSLQPGDLHVLHYRPVRQLAFTGSIQLI